MRLRVLHSVMLGACIAACSQVKLNRPQQVVAPKEPVQLEHPHIVQVDYGQNAHYVVCRTGDCPVRTQKTIPSSDAVRPVALIEPEPAPAITAPPVQTNSQTVTVTFPFGGAKLSADARAALREAMPAVKRATKIVVRGRTDNVGSERGNDGIALARAIAVRNFIRKSVPSGKGSITVESKGSCCYVADNETAEGRDRNRRVEVELVLGS